MARNKTTNNEYQRKWYASLSPEDKKFHNKKRAVRYKKQQDGYAKKHRQLKPENWQAQQANARVRKFYKNAGQIPNKELAAWIKVRRNKSCIYCGSISTHIDHIIPLVRGGKHSFDNIEMICANCNFSKRAQTKEEFLFWIKQLIKYQQENVNNET